MLLIETLHELIEKLIKQDLIFIRINECYVDFAVLFLLPLVQLLATVHLTNETIEDVFEHKLPEEEPQLLMPHLNCCIISEIIKMFT